MVIRPRPTPEIDLVFHPQRDKVYVHFESGDAHPFDSAPGALGRRNAWWLAEAALLTYWPAGDVAHHYARVGFETEPIFSSPTQSYVAWNDSAVLVSFRGTEPGEPGDVLDDVTFALDNWERSKSFVHAGFKQALERVWPFLRPRLDGLAASRTVWFTGHSLGAALATLAADLFPGTAGVCALGSPRVGDRRFARAYSKRFGHRALRYVNDADIVTHLPPPVPYTHAGSGRYIDPTGRVSSAKPSHDHFFRALIGNPAHVREVRQCLYEGQTKEAPDFLLDHMPRAYAVDVWNDYVRFGD